MNTNIAETSSYMLNRTGELIPVKLHVPSTTNIHRKCLHLCPVDADFLLAHDFITIDEAFCILAHCFRAFYVDVQKQDPSSQPSIMDIFQFRDFAELKYTPMIAKLFDSSLDEIKKSIEEEYSVQFISLQQNWYPFLKNNFVKVYVLNKMVDFRICCDDDFNWLTVIQKVCQEKFGDEYHFNIVRETENGYGTYLVNATLEELMKTEQLSCSKEMLERYAMDKDVTYR